MGEKITKSLKDRFRDVKEGRIKAVDEYYLAGVMKGYFTNFTEVKQMETRTDSYSSQNVGIAAVIPCYQLQEILFGEELTKIRKEYEKQMTAAQA